MRTRRDFLRSTITLAGLAGAAASAGAPQRAFAQAPPPPVRRSDRYDDTFIFERKPFTWPGKATLAVWVVPNVEVWRYDSPAGQGVSPN